MLFFTYVFIFFKLPFLTVLLVILHSYILAYNKNIEKVIFYFLILSFFPPYGFISLSNYSTLGNYINEGMLFQVYLYIFYLVNQINSISFKSFSKSQKNSFFFINNFNYFIYKFCNFTLLFII